MRHFLLLLTFPLIFQALQAREAGFHMASLFTDSMVVQQKSAIPIWGEGIPGSNIVVRASWNKGAAAVVRPDGSWDLTLNTPAAGGPYKLEIRHGDSLLVLSNVMVGEVWLCSGQSNMEMPLEGWPADSILHSAEEIRNSSYPDVRLFTVRRAFSPEPESRCDGKWQACTPKTSPSFSATAYYFGTALARALKVPIGLIHSSWGGTAIESWISAPFLARIPSFDTTLAKIKVTKDSIKVLQAWLNQFPTIDMSGRPKEGRWANLSFGDDDCSRPDFNDAAWGTMKLPTLWEQTSVGEFDGAVWFRKSVTIPRAWLRRDLVLELGPVDDIDITYVNGRKVGSHENEGMWNVPRVYTVPAALLDTTAVEIAVRVIDFGGGGGIYGRPETLCIHPADDGQKVSLAGEWKFLPVADYRSSKFYVFGTAAERFFQRPKLPMDFSGYSPTALYNGMIAPLVPFRLAGVIWYQGESNVGRAALYARLFPLMIENWRSAFKSAALPFDYVQIAPYTYGPGSESQLLREAQLATLSVPHTGMAVTMDIGSVQTIHPGNKEEVGRRLALWALAKTYGKKLECSGPLYRSFRKTRNGIELLFDHAGKGLVLTQNVYGNGFSIAGEDRVFHAASVEVRGNRLIVSSREVRNPQAVRYDFTDTAQGTLFNVEGLPASSFRTDTWPH